MASDNNNTNIIIKENYETNLNHLYYKVQMDIKRLRNNKTAGSDDIEAEMIKGTTEKGVDIMHKTFSKIWTTVND